MSSQHQVAGVPGKRRLLDDLMREPAAKGPGKGVPGFPDPLTAKYEPQRVLGRGGMGTVYLVTRVDDGAVRALKVLRPELAERPALVRRFLLEAEQTKLLEHPGIVRVFEHGEVSGAFYIEMEALEGRDLRSMLALGPLSISRAVSITCEALEALDEAHRLGIAHRDVKPSNLFIAHHGERESVKLLDLGLAAALGQSHGLTHHGDVVGTPAYMAPEQLQENGQAGVATDIYGMGVTLFELVTGQAAAHCENTAALAGQIVRGEIRRDPRELRDDAPLWLAVAIARATALRATDRYQTAPELRAALLGGASQVGVGQRLRFVGGRVLARANPRVLFIGLVLLACVAVGAALSAGTRSVRDSRTRIESLDTPDDQAEQLAAEIQAAATDREIGESFNTRGLRIYKAARADAARTGGYDLAQVRRAKSWFLMAQGHEDTTGMPTWNLACMNALLGDADGAIAAVHKLEQDGRGEAFQQRICTDDDFCGLANDARLSALEQRMGCAPNARLCSGSAP